MPHDRISRNLFDDEVLCAQPLELLRFRHTAQRIQQDDGAVLCGNGNVQFGRMPVEEVVTTGKAGMSRSQLRQIKIHAPTGNALLRQVFHQEAHRAAYVQSVGRTESTGDRCNVLIKFIAGFLIHPDEFWVLVSLPIELYIFHGTILPIALPSPLNLPAASLSFARPPCSTTASASFFGGGVFCLRGTYAFSALWSRLHVLIVVSICGPISVASGCLPLSNASLISLSC